MSHIYKLIEASFMQDMAAGQTPQPGASTPTPSNNGVTPATANPAQQQNAQTQPDKQQQQNPKNAIDIMTVLKAKGIDVSNPIIAQVVNKLNPTTAPAFFEQMINSLQDPKQMPEVLTSLLDLSTQLKNFTQLPTILKTLGSANTTQQS